MVRSPALIRTLRPHQWVKNIFVLAALVFARGQQHGGGRLLSEGLSDVWRTLFAFVAFCLASSTIYVINDIMDVESDRAHPEKSKRPIAAGELSITAAVVVAIACAVGALFLASFAGGTGRAGDSEPWSVCAVVVVYMTMNFAYSVKLKRIVILDAFCIAIGFLLRVKAGGYAASSYVSHWLMLCTLFLALFLALCKRRAEIDLLGDKSGSHRKILREYTPAFLDQMITMLAATTIVCYTMYTVAEDTEMKFGYGNHLVYSVPFVVFGLARYMLLVQTQKGGGSPTKVLLGGDGLFVLNGLAWMGLVAAVLFGPL